VARSDRVIEKRDKKPVANSEQQVFFLAPTCATVVQQAKRCGLAMEPRTSCVVPLPAQTSSRSETKHTRRARCGSTKQGRRCNATGIGMPYDEALAVEMETHMLRAPHTREPIHRRRRRHAPFIFFLLLFRDAPRSAV
jgi:hypothetical protein